LAPIRKSFRSVDCACTFIPDFTMPVGPSQTNEAYGHPNACLILCDVLPPAMRLRLQRKVAKRSFEESGGAACDSMGHRIRHCVECPKCWTGYLLARSPYFNGPYLIPTVSGSLEEYTLYCSCATTPVRSHWRWDEMKTYKVSKAAYDRGFGTPDEVFAMRRRRPSTEAAPRYEVTETRLSSHFARESLARDLS
jgi:hypothetical protein